MIEKHFQEAQQFLIFMGYQAEFVNSQLFIYDADGEIIDYSTKVIDNYMLFVIETEDDIFSYTWRCDNEKNYMKAMTVYRNNQNITLVVEGNNAKTYNNPIISLEIEDVETEDFLSIVMCNSDFSWIEFKLNKLEGDYQTSIIFELKEENDLYPFAKYVEELRNYPNSKLSSNGFKLTKIDNQSDTSILNACLIKDIDQNDINNYEVGVLDFGFEEKNYQIDQSYDEVLNQFLSSPKVNGFISFVNQELVEKCPEMIYLLKQNKQFEKIGNYSWRNNDGINNIIGNFVPSFQKVKTKKDN